MFLAVHCVGLSLHEHVAHVIFDIICISKYFTCQSINQSLIAPRVVFFTNMFYYISHIGAGTLNKPFWALAQAVTLFDRISNDTYL